MYVAEGLEIVKVLASRRARGSQPLAVARLSVL
jgi:hypothetical protein